MKIRALRLRQLKRLLGQRGKDWKTLRHWDKKREVLSDALGQEEAPTRQRQEGLKSQDAAVS